MSDLTNTMILVRATGGEGRLVLTGYALAMAMLCEALIANDEDVYAAMDDMKAFYEEAEKLLPEKEAPC